MSENLPPVKARSPLRYGLDSQRSPASEIVTGAEANPLVVVV